MYAQASERARRLYQLPSAAVNTGPFTRRYNATRKIREGDFMQRERERKTFICFRWLSWVYFRSLARAWVSPSFFFGCLFNRMKKMSYVETAKKCTRERERRDRMNTDGFLGKINRFLYMHRKYFSSEHLWDFCLRYKIKSILMHFNYTYTVYIPIFPAGASSSPKDAYIVPIDFAAANSFGAKTLNSKENSLNQRL